MNQQDTEATIRVLTDITREYADSPSVMTSAYVIAGRVGYVWDSELQRFVKEEGRQHG